MPAKGCCLDVKNMLLMIVNKCLLYQHMELCENNILECLSDTEYCATKTFTNSKHI